MNTDNDNLYNITLKKEFIVNLEGELKDYFISLFKSTAHLEESYGMDLFDFNLGQFKQLFFTYEELESLLTVKEALEAYVDWSVINGYRSTNVNILRLIEDDMLSQYIDS